MIGRTARFIIHTEIGPVNTKSAKIIKRGRSFDYIRLYIIEKEIKTAFMAKPIKNHRSFSIFIMNTIINGNSKSAEQGNIVIIVND